MTERRVIFQARHLHVMAYADGVVLYLYKDPALTKWEYHDAGFFDAATQLAVGDIIICQNYLNDHCVSAILTVASIKNNETPRVRIH